MQSEIVVITEALGTVGNPTAILSPIGLSKPGVPEHPQAAKPRVRKQILRMIVIMAAVAIAVGAISIWLLYSAALNEKRTDLIQIVQSQARLISALPQPYSSPSGMMKRPREPNTNCPGPVDRPIAQTTTIHHP